MKALNRRQFILAGAASTAALATSGRAATLDGRPWNALADRSLKKFRDPLATTCPVCTSRCTFIAGRYDGKAMGLLPLAGGCPRGLASFEALYDGERILSPMKRDGERGSGKWKRISWEEAEETINLALSGKKRTAIADLGRPDPIAGLLLERAGFDQVVTADSSTTWGSSKVQREIYGTQLARPDLSRANLVILLGAMPFEDNRDTAGMAVALNGARDNGAKVLSISAYQGESGSYADRWFPVRVGAESAFAFAIARRVLESNPIYERVLGSFSNLSLEEAKELLAPYDDAKLAEYGIDKAVVDEAATLFLKSLATVTVTTSDGRADASNLETAAALLNVLGGAIITGGVTAGAAMPKELAAVPTASRGEAYEMVNKRGASVYLAYRANPVFSSALFEKNVEKVNLVVAFDTHMTETAKVADIVLPAATDLECWNFLSAQRGRILEVRLQRPVTTWASEIETLRKEDIGDKTAAMGILFGGAKPAPFKGTRQLGDLLISLVGEMGTVAEVMENAAKGFNAKGLEALSGAGLPVARVSTPAKVTLTAEGFAPVAMAEGEGYNAVVVNHPALDPAYANTSWGRELAHNLPIYMSAAAAKKAGIHDGATVEVKSATGSGTATVKVIQGIHPEAVAFYAECGHWAAGSVAAQAENGYDLHIERRDLFNVAKRGFSMKGEKKSIPAWAGHGTELRAEALAPVELTPSGEMLTDFKVTVEPTRGGHGG
ncbi:MAG: hypothetical protein C0608_01720 [Deltaproteobacteria bacterium]|nr:MAG: hypothetical protein C0608_01720 [Deltaproteobacteria bacterium]